MQPVILPRDAHSLSRSQIDDAALKVLYRLNRSGFIAYLVGGGVRDLLLGRKPKDFDVSTSASPRDVKRLFRNCRLIGRRFRLAHVVFGPNHVIEVSTFRRKAEDPAPGEDLLMRDDNAFGSPEEDAERRDITINGLFYDITTFSIIDYVGGLRDLDARTIRTIGDPNLRLREDPVRMLRVVKFAARLGFQISDGDLTAMRRHRADLLKTSPERLRLELGRLLGSGFAGKSCRLLAETGLLEVLAPELDRRPKALESLFHDLEGLDQLIASKGIQFNELRLAVPLGILLRSTFADTSPNRDRATVEFNRRGLGFASNSVEWIPRTSNKSSSLLKFLARFTIPRRDGERIGQILSGQHRIAQAGDRRGGLDAATNRPGASEALAVYCAHRIGHGFDVGAELARLSRIGGDDGAANVRRRRGPEGPSDTIDAPRPRQRRRRGSRPPRAIDG